MNKSFYKSLRTNDTSFKRKLIGELKMIGPNCSQPNMMVPTTISNRKKVTIMHKSNNKLCIFVCSRRPIVSYRHS